MSWASKLWLEEKYTELGLTWQELTPEQTQQFWDRFLSTFVNQAFAKRFDKAYNAGPAIRREWLTNAREVGSLDDSAEALCAPSRSEFHAAVMWGGPLPSKTATYVLSGTPNSLARLFPMEGDALAVFLGSADHVTGCVWRHEETFLLAPSRSKALATLIRGD